MTRTLYRDFWLDFRFYTRRLVDMGVPYDNYSTSKRSAVDELLWHIQPCFLSDDLIDLSVDLSINMFDDKGTLPGFESPHRQLFSPANSVRIINKMVEREDGRLMMSLMGDTAFQNEYRKNDLVKTILLKSTENLQADLNSKSSMLNLRGPLGDSPVYWCVAWPEGLEQLIAAGAELNICDNEGWMPLYYAIACKDAKSVDLILEAKSKLHLHPKLSTLSMTLNVACSYYDFGVFQTLVSHLARRRTELQRIAEASLAYKTLQKLQLPKDKLLDGLLVEKVETALLADNISVEPHLLQEFEYLSVYHTSAVSIEMAEHFWKAGFRDLNLLDVGNWGGPLTPMWSQLRGVNYGNTVVRRMISHSESQIWDLMQWFQVHGASLEYYFIESWEWYKGNRISIKNDITKTFALCLKRRMRDDAYASKEDAVTYITSLKPSHRGLFLKSLTYDVEDGCRCACSSSGCLPVTSLVNSLMRLNYQHSPMQFRGLGATLDLVLSALNDMEEKRRIMLEAIRFASFCKLDLTHSCCQYRPTKGRGRIRSLEAQEIREEESQSISQLEILMQEFEAQFDLEKMSLERFFYEIWEGRMDEYFEETTVDAEVISGVRERRVYCSQEDTLTS